MQSVKLTKTLTFGLGTIYGFDRKAGTLFTLEDDARKRAYTNLKQCFRDFARLCNYTTSLFYSQRTLGTDLKSMGFSTSYTEILDKLNLNTPLASRALNQAYVVVSAHFTGENRKGLMRKGERVLPIHKADGTHPLFFHKDATEIKKIDGKYYICYNLFSQSWVREHGLPSWYAFEIKIKKRDKGGMGRIDKIIEGVWQRGGTQIARSFRDGQKYITRISVTYMPEPYKQLTDHMIMGVHFGLTVPVTIHFRHNGSNGNKWEMCIGNGHNMLAARGFVRGEITRILQATKQKDSPFTGAARQAMLERLKVLRGQERRMMKTAVQKIATTIADQAKRNGAGIWQVEKLDKTIKDKPFLVRNWAPGMLLDALSWQAKQFGAKIEYIKHNYTSQRCSKCGHISRENLPKGKKGASDFVCVACGFKHHVDKNAARNNSIVGIEEIIADKMKEIESKQVAQQAL